MPVPTFGTQPSLGIPGAPIPNPGAVMSTPTVKGTGNRVGWYLKRDGTAARLTVNDTDVGRYSRRGLRYMPEWGTYSTTAEDAPNGGGLIVPEGKYEQLARIARMQNPDGSPRFPEAGRALQLMYLPKSKEQTAGFECPCGQPFGNEFAFQAHQLTCPKATATAAQLAVKERPVDYRCRKKGCGQVFGSPTEVARHQREEHARKRTPKPPAPETEARDEPAGL